MFTGLDESLAREHYRQLQHEAMMEQLLKANRSPRKNFGQQLLVGLGNILISLGGRLQQDGESQSPRVPGLKAGAKGR